MKRASYVPSPPLGPVCVGDLLCKRNSQGVETGPPLTVIEVTATYVRTSCGRLWSRDNGEWIAEFRRGKPVIYPFPSVGRGATTTPLAA